MSVLLSDILVCPVCKGPLLKGAEDRSGRTASLVCPRCRLEFPIRHGIPVMLKDEARELTEEEAASFSENASKLDPARR